MLLHRLAEKIIGRFGSDKGILLIVHPEGNIHYNPSLVSIVSILSDSGFRIAVLSPFFICKEGLKIQGNVSLITIRWKYFQQINEMPATQAKWVALSRVIPILQQDLWPSLIIGVDRDGIIFSSRLSLLTGIPCAMVSYEIFFASETSYAFKQTEIEACTNIRFAISQDRMRSKFLSEENQISRDSIIDIPVAPRGSIAFRRSSRHGASKGNQGIRKRYKIKHKHIAIFVGSVDHWSMAYDIIASSKDWPSEWCLFVHGRYGLKRDELESLNATSGQNVYFSTDSFSDVEESSEMLLEADIGLAFYRPTYDNPWEGKNLKHLGLSSGKIASYLRAGLPIVLNRVGQYSRLIRRYEAGIIASDPSALPRILHEITDKRIEEMSQNAIRLYRERINTDLYKKPLLKAIHSALRS